MLFSRCLVQLPELAPDGPGRPAQMLTDRCIGPAGTVSDSKDFLSFGPAFHGNRQGT